MLGGEQSGHVIYLAGHVTGDGLAAALLLCGSLGEGTLSEAVAVMPRFPQAKENVRVSAGGARGCARRGGAAERRARRPGSRARPRLGHGAARPGARRGRNRRGGGDPLW